MRLFQRLRDIEEATRPVDPETEAALARRWASLPASAKVPGQLIGRKFTGCEATHGVFPQCDFACKPCYHSADANKVRIDGPHTLSEVRRQMAFLRRERGFGAYAQLIGGEVSLLSPTDHAAAIGIMRDHGRIPMSFTHGDFDYDYLRALAVDQHDRPRFPHLSFACHIDTTMLGRTGATKPTSEAQLHDHRRRFCELFDRLRAEYGISSYLAHNMTVTPNNLDQIADVIQSCHGQGWRMFSFQPAAYIGNENRWRDGYRELTSDLVWDEIQRGAGTRLPWAAAQVGDTRCNRVTWGAYLRDRYTPLLDDDDDADRRMVETWFDAFPGNFILRSKALSTLRYGRSIARRPGVVGELAAWAGRFGDRAGGRRQPWWRLKPVTFVMHRFIDAADTAAAWDHIQAGTTATEPRIVEAQERLEACAYSMGHPETGQLVPACVQHGVLDPEENRRLAELLPLPTRRDRASR
ncbi:MAG: radical SAM domain-containing protein [Acidimicrobiia bacterium]|nr:radical SAM domain-containing protein [Acidimicrobiia bacterium]